MSQGGFVVRLRGLPWNTRKDEIVRFLVECHIKGGDEGVHFTFSREGRPSGEAFVEFECEEDVTHALAQHNEHIGARYIEVFRVEKSEMEWTIKHCGAGAAAGQKNPDAVVRLRGLPFGCSKEEIAQFFTGLVIVPNGIMLPEDRTGRSTGEAFVQFSSPEIADKALEKHKERIGHRYIEIFKSCLAEADAVSRSASAMRSIMGPRPGPYDRGDRGFNNMGMGMNAMMNMGYGRGRGRNIKGFFEEDYEDFGFSGGFGGMRNRRGGGTGTSRGARGGMTMMDRGGQSPGSMYVSKTGHSVHLRGLPYCATVDDVFEFFTPIQPVRCELEYGDNGRPTGQANVDFVSHQEALEAMKKHKCNMKHRYIELFLNSEPPRNNAGGGGCYANGMGGGSFGMGSMGNDFQEDLGGFGQSSTGGFGGGYGSAGQAFGGTNQGGFGSQGNSGFGNAGGFGNQGMNSYDVGGGYGDGMGNSGGMMNNNYPAF